MFYVGLDRQPAAGIDRGRARQTTAVDPQNAAGIDRGADSRGPGMYRGPLPSCQHQSTESIGRKCDIRSIMDNDISPVFYNFSRRATAGDRQIAQKVDGGAVRCAAAGDIHVAVVVQIDPAADLSA